MELAALDLPALDWLGLAVLCLSIFWGAWRGLVFELLSLASWVLAFVLARWLADAAAAYLPLSSLAPVLQYAVGFAVVFVAAMFTLGMLVLVFSKLVSAVGLRPVDRLLGSMFGLLRGVVLIAVVVFVGGLTPVKDSAAWQSSACVHAARWLLQTLQPMLPPALEVN